MKRKILPQFIKMEAPELEIGTLYKAYRPRGPDPNNYYFIGTYEGIVEFGPSLFYRFSNARYFDGSVEQERLVHVDTNVMVFVKEPVATTGGYKKRKGRKTTRHRKSRRTSRNRRV